MVKSYKLSLIKWIRSVCLTITWWLSLILLYYIHLKSVKRVKFNYSHTQKMFKMWGDRYIIRVPKLWEQRPDDLRWSWCHNIRNEVHNKCNALESSWKYPHTPVHGKTAPGDQFHGRLGTTLWGESFHNMYVSQIIRLHTLNILKYDLSTIPQ